MIEIFADKCAKSTLLNGPFGGDDRAFDRLLGPAGILTRTSLVTTTTDGRVTYYGRTEAGKVYQQNLGTELNFLDPYNGGEGWKKKRSGFDNGGWMGGSVLHGCGRGLMAVIVRGGAGSGK